MIAQHREQSVILIIDDNLTNLEVLFQFLDESNFEVWVARTGESGIRKAQYDAPDLILLDVMMPGLDGFETCRLLKDNPKTCDIPIIFMTALSDTVDKVRGLSLGAVDYIVKPFQYEEVLARVKLHLRLRLLTQSLQQEVQQRTAAQAELQQLAAELEQRVDQRTLELRTALRDLQKTQAELLQQEEKLRYDAFHDSLTDLPNRAWFMERLQHAVQVAAGSCDYLYAVLFVDLDRFKVVNDSLGHLVGDRLLQSVARRLQSALSPKGAIARFGGDEFIILLENIDDPNDATQVAETIQAQFRTPFRIGDYELFAGASIGITLSTMGYQQPETVLRDADVALYHAKQAGKGRCSTVNSTMQTQAVCRLQFENDLRRGIEREEFYLQYQPIVAFSTGQLKGFEALVRWNHPERGKISPAEFIPVAEETGAIEPLGWWIFHQACTQLAQWQQQFPHAIPLTMNVNFSPLQLKQADLSDRVDTILRQTGICGSWLKLEITESCLLEAAIAEESTFNRLKSTGIQLCVDDFGTGYSSLSRLHEFPVDTLKIDRTFVSRLDDRSSNVEMVRTIVALAHAVEMDVVAEGIETLSQLEKLQELGCELGQGYFFSPPLDARAASQLLRERQRFETHPLRDRMRCH